MTGMPRRIFAYAGPMTGLRAALAELCFSGGSNPVQGHEVTVVAEEEGPDDRLHQTWADAGPLLDAMRAAGAYVGLSAYGDGFTVVCDQIPGGTSTVIRGSSGPLAVARAYCLWRQAAGRGPVRTIRRYGAKV